MYQNFFLRLSFTAFAAMSLLACGGNTKTEPNNANAAKPADTTKAAAPAPETAKNQAVVKNKADYAPEFLAELDEMLKGQPYELSGGMLILGGNDTTYLPAAPAVGKALTFKGQKGKRAVVLQCTRENQTTLAYSVELLEAGKSVHQKSGKARINASFFLGSESDESDKTKVSYAVAEFMETAGDCSISIRIGSEPETSPNKLLSKLIKNCNDKFGDIELENFPTLMEQ